ncbi:MAG TPA: 6-carboxytetrahydropterin synthase [Nitrospiraceae bacterium]|nr:6-carboxytetrahydropterin synthase [Nitrospiraceae bacterium]
MSDVRLTKRIEFSASHRYHNSAWDQMRNAAVFGACNLPPGHGHNYLLEVTIAGSVSQDTGMVVNLFDLKQVLLDVLVGFDHKHLNLDTPYFSTRIPTTENIATVLWSVLSARPEMRGLEKIRLYEEDDLYAEVAADRIAGGTAAITRRYHFSAAHRVHADHVSALDNQRLYGRCHGSSLHGHNYIVAVRVGGQIHPESGMVTDLTVLDRLVRETVLARFDARTLNDDPAFADIVPTGEQVAKLIWGLLVKQIVGGQLERIGVTETPESSFEYVGERP